MGIKKHKPTTPSLRWTTTSSFEEITKNKPEKSLLLPKKRCSGRNVHGHVTVRHRGGGHKRKIRIIDFKREKRDMPGEVIAIEYDPNRSARIALVKYTDEEKRYIICPKDLKVGNIIEASENANLNPGCALPLRNIPSGIPIHNVELFKNQGATCVRAAGTSTTIMAKEEKFAHVKLPSGEIRKIDLNCFATVGEVGNLEHRTLSKGKAGRSRWLGIRPSVRGVAQNPVDHPMGGGEGKSSGGRHPCTPWGKITKGLKTRKKHKASDKYIVKRRR